MAAEKLAVIVPYKNRRSHLEVFCREVPSFLLAKKIPFKIFIVEQNSNSAFNKGVLLNIGCLVAQQEGYTYFALHDVDTIPVSPTLDYSLKKTPKHLYGPSHAAGGVILISQQEYQLCNGMSNRYTGWGREDVDFMLRIKYSGLILNQDQLTERKESDYENEIYHNGWKLLPHRPTFIYDNGLFTEEEINSIEEKSDFAAVQRKFHESKNWQEFKKFEDQPDLYKEDGLSSLSFNLITREFLNEHVELLVVNN